ncbi:MAG: roadblock/LC7 domain-containing protein [ANME-2 cluster archaeon]|jgi:predicted regulator of Ras-like GTPase activity (Roadblock/LC7/MglB family)|nr:roadblock/LC7 domain-containing protein [ANME-2 cluster archaeon]
MENIQEMLNTVLQDLKSIANIEASVIVSHQGLTILSDVPDYVPEAKLAAFTATIMGSAKTVMEELRQKSPNMLIIRSIESIAIFMEAGENAILGTLFSDDGNIGLVIVEMEKACKKINAILE